MASEGNHLPDDIEMLSQPLTTDEGFLNEACLRELESAIINMPEAWDRLAGDPEWSTKMGATLTEVLSSFAKSTVQGFCGEVPPKFAEVFGFLRASLVTGLFSKCSDADIDFRYRELSLCEINKMLWDILGDLGYFMDWNDSEQVGERWVDLSALLHNVCLEIRSNRRHYVAFDRQFEKDHR